MEWERGFYLTHLVYFKFSSMIKQISDTPQSSRLYSDFKLFWGYIPNRCNLSQSFFTYIKFVVSTANFWQLLCDLLCSLWLNLPKDICVQTQLGDPAKYLSIIVDQGSTFFPLEFLGLRTTLPNIPIQQYLSFFLIPYYSLYADDPKLLFAYFVSISYTLESFSYSLD